MLQHNSNTTPTQCPNCRSSVTPAKASTFKVPLVPATVQLTMDATGDNIDKYKSYDVITILCQVCSLMFFYNKVDNTHTMTTLIIK